MRVSYALVGLLGAPVLACPEHNTLGKRGDSERGFSYYEAQDWGHLKDDYALCQTGTMQTPLRLSHASGYANTHQSVFNYHDKAKGYLENSGTSTNFTLEAENTTSLPPFSFEESVVDQMVEVYLIGWHIHAPSEHIIDGTAARSEMHFVHSDAEGNLRSVVAFIIEPSGANGTESAFFNQIPLPLPQVGSDERTTFALNPALPIAEVGGFKEYWTYKGSLSTPPCSEGLRWFVAAKPLRVRNDMMERILGVSMFSARPSQSLWMHELNM